MPGILNFTTKVEAENSAAQITALLARKGARRITQEYDDKQRMVGVSFTFEVKGVPVYFVLPANEAGVEAYMRRQRKGSLARAQEESLRAQARRTAWRILKDWTEAQIALVESQQAEMAQVFLPYAQDERGTTVYQHFLEGNANRALGPGTSDED